jgi:hypothetical protein
MKIYLHEVCEHTYNAAAEYLCSIQVNVLPLSA